MGLNYFYIRTEYYTPIESIFNIIFACSISIISAVVLSKSARLDKKLRIQMEEYFSLLNRVHEGVIVLSQQ